MVLEFLRETLLHPSERVHYHTENLLIRHFFQSKSIDIFLISLQNLCCGYSLEAPHRDFSNEYLQYMFSCRNQKNFYLIPAHLDLSMQIQHYKLVTFFFLVFTIHINFIRKFSQKIGSDISSKLSLELTCQSLFSGKNKKNISKNIVF